MHVPRVSRKDILHDIDDALKNLQVDYVDLYWLHHDDEKISVEEIIDTLVALVREGKIRYLGALTGIRQESEKRWIIPERKRSLSLWEIR